MKVISLSNVNPFAVQHGSIGQVGRIVDDDAAVLDMGSKSAHCGHHTIGSVRTPFPEAISCPELRRDDVVRHCP